MDKWQYGWACFNPQSDQVTSIVGRLPHVDGSDLLTFVDRAGDVGWEAITIVPLDEDTRMFFKRRVEPVDDAPLS